MTTYSRDGGPGRSTNPYDPTAVTADDTHVYWANDRGEIHRAEKSGSGGGLVALGPRDPHGLAVHGAFVYWTSFREGRVLRAPKAGGAAEELASEQRGAWGVCADDAHVYWACFAAGSICRLRLGGREVEIIASGQKKPSQVAVDEAFVYWSNRSGEGGRYHLDDGAVMRAPKAGGAPVVLAAGQEQPALLGVDGRSVYWIPYHDAVRSMDKGGGAMTTLLSRTDVEDQYAMIWDAALGSEGVVALASGPGWSSRVMRARGEGPPAALEAVTDVARLVVAGAESAFVLTRDGDLVAVPLAGGPARVAYRDARPALAPRIAADGAGLSEGPVIADIPLPKGGRRVKSRAGPFVRDGATIYYQVVGPGSRALALWAIDAGARAGRKLADLPRGAAEPATNRSHVYLRHGDALARVPKAGGKLERLFDMPGMVMYAVDEEHVYWLRHDGDDHPILGAVLRAPLAPGGRAEVLARGEREPSCLALDGTHVHWCTNDVAALFDDEDDEDGKVREPLAIRRVSKGGGAIDCVVSGAHAWSIAVDDERVWWADHELSAIMSAPKAGGPASTRLRVRGSSSCLHAVGPDLFWTTSAELNGPAWIVTAPKRGGPARLLAETDLSFTLWADALGPCWDANRAAGDDLDRTPGRLVIRGVAAP